MTRNLRLLIGAGLVFYLIGAVNQSVGMYVLAAACLAVILACYSLTRLVIRGVTVELELESVRTRAGEQANGVIRVRNAGAIRRTGMSLALRVENETVAGGGRDYEFVLPALGPRSRTDMDICLQCSARGAHTIRSMRITANDPLGVYHRWRAVDANTGFLGLPRAHSAERLANWDALSSEGRRSARVLRRAGGEFQGIRPHTPGDDPRMVHWKVTAHLGELVVRQHRPRREAGVTAWVDLWRPNHPFSGADSPTETVISLTATLLDILLHGDTLVSLAGHGLPMDFAMPSRGEAYLDRYLLTLAEAVPTEGLSFSQFCEEQARVSPRLRNVFVVTPAAEPALVDVLALIRNRGARVVVLFAGGLEQQAESVPDRLRAHAHDQTIGALRGLGVCAVRVRDFDDIPRAISEVASDQSSVAAAG